MNEPDWKGALGEASTRRLLSTRPVYASDPELCRASRRFERLWVAPCQNGQWIPER